jgi:endoglucanase
MTKIVHRSEKKETSSRVLIRDYRRMKSTVAATVFSLLGVTAIWTACAGHTRAPGLVEPTTSADGFPTVVLGKSKGKGLPAPAMPGVNVPAIKINTVGFPAHWTKVAIFNVDPTGAVIVDHEDRVVFRVDSATVEERGTDDASKDPVWQVDFTALQALGRYQFQAGEMLSDPFLIFSNPYEEAIVAGLKSFYFQRTRTALEAPYAVWNSDSYLRPGVSHDHEDVGWDVLDYPDKKRKWKLEGGWHDAGNFDMYVPSTAPTAQALLLAYLWNPGNFSDGQLNIPESTNGIPDILDEVRWGLDWILSVQEDTGAFRHRESVMGFSPEGPAHEDKTVRWVSGISSSATAKAVAVLAMAANIYRRWDKEYAEKCAAAARAGWRFLVKHPEHIRSKKHGSAQPLWDDEPENNDVGARFIAAVEIWLLDADPVAFDILNSLMETEETTDLKEIISGAWANLSRWGLARLASAKQTPTEIREVARKRLLAAADLMVSRVRHEDGYRCASTLDDYYWAHNSNLMEKTHILAVAARLSPETNAYLEAARDQWHWVLGRNPNGYSMVTRVGKGPPRLYHMEWGNAEPPPPGFLLGGPNYANMAFLAPDAPAKALLWENPVPLRSGLPAKSLWHWRQSDLWDGGFIAEDSWTDGWWAVTEPDILYSANFVLAGVSIQ